ncbi:MAG: hypothetical protein ACI8UO_004787 [Verrucomicrobiales bacterium]
MNSANIITAEQFKVFSEISARLGVCIEKYPKAAKLCQVQKDRLKTVIELGSQGNVRFKGNWITRGEYDKLLAAQKQLEKEQMEERARIAQEKVAAMRREEEKRLKEIEQQRLREEKQREEQRKMQLAKEAEARRLLERQQLQKRNWAQKGENLGELMIKTGKIDELDPFLQDTADVGVIGNSRALRQDQIFRNGQEQEVRSGDESVALVLVPDSVRRIAALVVSDASEEMRYCRIAVRVEVGKERQSGDFRSLHRLVSSVDEPLGDWFPTAVASALTQLEFMKRSYGGKRVGQVVVERQFGSRRCKLSVTGASLQDDGNFYQGYDLEIQPVNE